MKISASIEILSSPKDIFLWIDNPDEAKQWQKGIKGEEIIKETANKVGTTFKEELEENGKTLVMYGEITDYIPDKFISFRLESKIHRVCVGYTLIENNNKSLVTIDSTIKWKFPMNIITFLIGNKIREKILKQTKSELSDLKKLCETE